MNLHQSPALQHEYELIQLIELFQKWGVESYLEVGTRYGGTFERVITALPNCRGVAIDFPGGSFGDNYSVPFLMSVIFRLRKLGRDVDFILGPSSAKEVIERAESKGPYDAIFLDADHSYEAIKKDFGNYCNMAKKMIVLHDIAGEGQSENGKPVEVPRFWKEIKHWPHQEIVQLGSVMGIGIIFTNV